MFKYDAYMYSIFIIKVIQKNAISFQQQKLLINAELLQTLKRWI